VKTYVSLPISLYEQLQKMAKERRLSLSELIEKLLEKGMEAEK